MKEDLSNIRQLITDVVSKEMTKMQDSSSKGEDIAKQLIKDQRDIKDDIKNSLIKQALENNAKIKINQNVYQSQKTDPRLPFLIKEHILPQIDGNNLTFNTIRERKIINQVIWSRFNMLEGETLDFKNKFEDKHMKEILPILHGAKILEDTISDDIILNPYYDERFIANTIIWTACYPIKYDSDKKRIICSENNVNLSIRLYPLISDEVLFLKKIENILEYYLFIKKLVFDFNIPHFIVMFLYYYVKNININIDKIKKNIENHKAQFKLKRDKYLSKYKNILDEEKKRVENYSKELNAIKGGSTANNKYILSFCENANLNYDMYNKDLFHVENYIQKMNHVGFKNELEIKSFWFQISTIFISFLKHSFIIDDATLENNIFIKKSIYHKQFTFYYEYVIWNISYFIPHFGFIPFIDLNNAITFNEQFIKFENHDYDKFIIKFYDVVKKIFNSPLIKNDDNHKFLNNLIMGFKLEPHNTHEEHLIQIYNCIFDNFKIFLHNRIGHKIDQKDLIWLSNTKKSLDTTGLIRTNEFTEGEIVLYNDEIIALIKKIGDRQNIVENPEAIGQIYQMIDIFDGNNKTVSIQELKKLNPIQQKENNINDKINSTIIEKYIF